MKTARTKTKRDSIPSKAVIASIMDRAMQIDRGTKDHCREFKILVSKTHPDTLILRWITIDITDIDRPVQCYRYECFDMDGTPQQCSIHYSDQQQANEFFAGLTTLYTQECAIDHKL